MLFQHNSPLGRNRQPSSGSAITSIIIFAAGIALISGYFLTHAVTESRMATRSFYQSTAINLAEAGIDVAMLAINNANVGTSTGWRTATNDATAWVKTIGGSTDDNFDLGQGFGTALVRIDGWTAGTTSVVTVTSLGQVTIARMPTINKQVVVKVAKRSAQGAAILVKGAVTFNGSVAIDAYDSTKGVPGLTNMLDQATVASVSSTATVSVGGNSLIYGSVVTGGSPPIVGTNGRIYGATTPAGVKIDPTRVRTDFSQNIPDAIGPVGTPINLGAMSSNLTLPRAGDMPEANGRYLYTDGYGGLQLNGTTVLTIKGPVDLVLRANMQMGGNGKLLVTSINESAPSLNIYAYAGVQFDGNGLVNTTHVPSKVHVYVLGNSDVQLNGNATFAGIIYAPNSNIQSNGNGDINGALTGKAVNFNGNAKLHYDINLLSGSTSPYYAVRSWVELTDAHALASSNFRRDNRDPFTFLE